MSIVFVMKVIFPMCAYRVEVVALSVELCMDHVSIHVYRMYVYI
jgi:hypothetical protein